MVKAIIETMPDHFAPDEHNLLPDGKRYKAPDHSVLGGSLLIERKSRSDDLSEKVVRRLTKLGLAQGWRGGAYGKHRLDRIMSDFPNLVAANREITDYIFRQMLKRLREANKKFIVFAKHNPAAHSTRVVIVSDHSTQPGGNAADEAFIGRKMGGYSPADDNIPYVDAVILLKHPSYVFDEENSYWLKCLIRGSLSEQNRDKVVHLASKIHNSFALIPEFTQALTKLRMSAFRVTLISS
ncbi:hypothetical protein [Qipengyuania pelagi]|uniref:hypothetical protein n=1 Tax=Qipengyuania pelagi TaxID=994320 RepID=UPI00136973E4|nr:hypothetical protein [Qipengyuania pelagi]